MTTLFLAGTIGPELLLATVFGLDGWSGHPLTTLKLSGEPGDFVGAYLRL